MKMSQDHVEQSLPWLIALVILGERRGGKPERLAARWDPLDCQCCDDFSDAGGVLLRHVIDPGGIGADEAAGAERCYGNHDQETAHHGLPWRRIRTVT
jgi:hypothetical protein